LQNLINLPYNALGLASVDKSYVYEVCRMLNPYIANEIIYH